MGRSGAILTETSEIGGKYMKRGLDYYSIPCVEDERLELIEAELGIESFAVIIKLLGKIYGQNGYYCQWDEDCAMLFARKNGVGYELVCRVVDAAVKRGFFSREQLEENGILTSAEIQQFFLNAAKRRKEFSIDPRFSCISAHTAEKVKTAVKAVGAVTAETAARDSVCFPENDTFIGIEEPAEPYINESFSECGGCVTVVYPDCGNVGIGEESPKKCDRNVRPDEKKQAYGRYGNVMLTEGEHVELKKRIRNADDYIDRFSRKLRDKGYRYTDHFGAILDWWVRDSVLPEANGGNGGNGGNGAPMASFDTDDFFAAALNKASRKPDAA